jgi:hypothetical protein
MFILVFMLAIFCAIYNLFSLNNNVQKFQMMETQIKEHTLGEKIMKNTRILYSLCSILGAVFLLIGLVATTRAGSEIALSAGQTVYVPIYSHIYSGLRGNPFSLAATLSIRNTDPKNPITLVSVKFFDSEGKLVKEYLDKPAELKAMASTRYIRAEGDTAGGSGANFLVTWQSRTKVNPPLIEGVMIGTRSGQGISFVSRGQVINE